MKFNKRGVVSPPMAVGILICANPFAAAKALMENASGERIILARTRRESNEAK